MTHPETLREQIRSALIAKACEYLHLERAACAMLPLADGRVIAIGALADVRALLASQAEPAEPTDEQYQDILRPVLSRYGMHRFLNGDEITLNPSDYRAIIKHAIEFASAAPLSQPHQSVVAAEPEHMNTQSSREYLVTFMEQYFTDKTYHRYIRGDATRNHLAGDFAWQMARALRMIEGSATPSAPVGQALDLAALTDDDIEELAVDYYRAMTDSIDDVIGFARAVERHLRSPGNPVSENGGVQ